MDKLAQIDPMIDWELLRPIVKELYRNDTEKGGRPNIDEIVMIKTLFLQSMYNCSDDVMERELHDRISFRNFLHYPEIIPDSRTIWLFRERLSTTGKDKIIWNAIWKQFEDRGISIKKGMVQDATFIETDPGKHRRKKPPVPVDPESAEMKKDEAASTETKKTLQSMKLHPRETYEEVIERMIEDLSELNEETIREVEGARREIESGKFVTHEQLKKDLGL